MDASVIARFIEAGWREPIPWASALSSFLPVNGAMSRAQAPIRAGMPMIIAAGAAIER